MTIDSNTQMVCIAVLPFENLSGLSLSYFNEWSCQLWEQWNDFRMIP